MCVCVCVCVCVCLSVCVYVCVYVCVCERLLLMAVTICRFIDFSPRSVLNVSVSLVGKVRVGAHAGPIGKPSRQLFWPHNKPTNTFLKLKYAPIVRDHFSCFLTIKVICCRV